MRKFLLLLCFAVITLSAHAQFSIGIGWWRGSSAGSASFKWQKGYYYSKAGNKTNGLFKSYLPEGGILGVSGKDLFFKTDSNAKKTTVKFADIQSFVINYKSGESDSFIVTNSSLLTKSPLVRILVDGPVKLYGLLYTYTSYSGNGIASGSGAKERYYFGPDAHTIEQVNYSNFAAAMGQVMAAKPEIIEGIKAGKYKFNNIDHLIEFYNLDAEKNLTWHTGHYYDMKGNVVNGFFAKNRYNGLVAGTDGKMLFFRSSPSSETLNLKPEDLSRFLVTDSARKDSFVVSKSPALAGTPFIKVFANQPLKLYGVSAEQYKGKIERKYYFGKTPDDVTELNKKNFIPAMTDVMADQPATVRLIQKKMLHFYDMDSLYVYFKTGFWPAPPVEEY